MHQDGTSAATTTAGWDWSTSTHVLSLVDAAGVECDRLEVDNTAAGIARAVGWLLDHAVAGVAIERPDGPVVEALLAAELGVVVIPPRQLAKLRGRYGSAGNKDDRRDAFVLADTLRTDWQRLQFVQLDSPATVALRGLCRARRALVEHRVAVTNQLRAHLQTVLPGAVGLFSRLESAISLAFLRDFGGQGEADALSVEALAGWLQAQGYSGGKSPEVLYAHLQAAPRGPTGAAAATLARVTRAYVETIAGLATQIRELETQIETQLEQHPDGHIFTSFPRSGRVRAATLLAELGDCRARFPDPESLQGLAGICPSTRQSGKHRAAVFRWACDKRLRAAITDFVSDTPYDNAWAADLYTRAKQRHGKHPVAQRILARAWSYVIWRCWHDRTPYDPTKHHALQNLLQHPQPQPA